MSMEGFTYQEPQGDTHSFSEIWKLRAKDSIVIERWLEMSMRICNKDECRAIPVSAFGRDVVSCFNLFGLVFFRCTLDALKRYYTILPTHSAHNVDTGQVETGSWSDLAPLTSLMRVLKI